MILGYLLVCLLVLAAIVAGVWLILNAIRYTLMKEGGVPQGSNTHPFWGLSDKWLAAYKKKGKK